METHDNVAIGRERADFIQEQANPGDERRLNTGADDGLSAPLRSVLRARRPVSDGLRCVETTSTFRAAVQRVAGGDSEGTSGGASIAVRWLSRADGSTIDSHKSPTEWAPRVWRRRLAGKDDSRPKGRPKSPTDRTITAERQAQSWSPSSHGLGTIA